MTWSVLQGTKIELKQLAYRYPTSRKTGTIIMGRIRPKHVKITTSLALWRLLPWVWHQQGE